QRADSMDLDNLPSHTAKKVKATLLEEISTATPIELLPTQTALAQNDKKLEPLKILQDTSIPKKGTDLPDIKFSHNNPYIVKMHMPDPNKKPQELLQQPDPAQVNEYTNKQNKNVAMDRKPGPPNSEDDMTPIIGNTTQHMMDTNAISNATIEGTKTINNITTENSMDWPDIVRTRVANKSIDLREEEQDATKWNYDTILQAFNNIKEPEAAKNKEAKPQLPKDKKTLQKNIKMIDEASQIPITEYNIINSTLEWLRKKYEYDRIPAYLLELPDQLHLNWGIYKYDNLY
ncbi:20430_t:CDS:2, partial [Gigaspora margarita]